MAKGGSPTQTTTTEMSPEQQSLFNLAMPGITQWAANVPQRYQGTTVAPENANQIAGQNQALDAAPDQTSLAAGGASVTNNLFNNIWDPAFNPNLQGSIDAAVRPITQNFQNTVLPGIRGGAITTGGFGGSRQGVAEANASDAYMRNVSDTASKVAEDEYSTNINAQLKALGLLPATTANLTQGAQTTSAVGDVQNAYDQALINQNVGNYNYDTNAQYLQAKDILALLQGIPGGTTVSTGNTSSSPTAMSSLSGGLAGAQLGSLLMPGAGTAIGAGAGALLPWIFS